MLGQVHIPSSGDGGGGGVRFYMAVCVYTGRLEYVPAC
jgi:hypothetical protein